MFGLYAVSQGCVFFINISAAFHSMHVAARDESVRLGLAARGGRFVFTRGGRAAEPYGIRALRQAQPATEPAHGWADWPTGRQFLVQFLVHWSTFSILFPFIHVVSSN